MRAAVVDGVDVCLVGLDLEDGQGRRVDRHLETLVGRYVSYLACEIEAILVRQLFLDRYINTHAHTHESVRNMDYHVRGSSQRRSLLIVSRTQHNVHFAQQNIRAVLVEVGGGC